MGASRPISPWGGAGAALSRRSVLGALAALALPARGSAQPAAGRNWVVAVGVKQYTEGWAPLQYADRDAQLFARTLGAEPAATQLLTGPAPLPSRDAVLASLRTLAGRTGPEDVLWFYFSGHGYHAEGKSYAIPRGCPLADLQTRGLSVSELRSVLDDPQQCRARLRVIVLDACHSGSTKGGPPATWEKVFRGVSGTAILAASQIGEPAHELAALRGGVFTHYLIRALSGEAAPKGGALTLQAVLDYVVRKVRDQTNTIQNPYFSLPDTRLGGLPLQAKGAPPELLAGGPASVTRRDPTLPGFVVLIDGKREEARIVETRLRQLLLDAGFPLVAADALSASPRDLLQFDPRKAARLATERNARFLLRGSVASQIVRQNAELADLKSATVTLTGELIDFDGNILDSQDGTELGAAVTRAAGTDLLALNQALADATANLFRKMRKRAREALQS